MGCPLYVAPFRSRNTASSVFDESFDDDDESTSIASSIPSTNRSLSRQSTESLIRRIRPKTPSIRRDSSIPQINVVPKRSLGYGLLKTGMTCDYVHQPNVVCRFDRSMAVRPLPRSTSMTLSPLHYGVTASSIDVNRRIPTSRHNVDLRRFTSMISCRLLRRCRRCDLDVLMGKIAVNSSLKPLVNGNEVTI
jgi:hypothetical protein